MTDFQRLFLLVTIILVMLSISSCNFKNSKNIGVDSCDYLELRKIPKSAIDYIEKYRLNLPDDARGAISTCDLEITLIHHCYECSDEERFAIFYYFRDKAPVAYMKVTAEGDVEVVDQIKPRNKLSLEIIRAASNLYVSRECHVAGGSTSDIAVKDMINQSYATYFESLGYRGNKITSKDHYFSLVKLADQLYAL